MPKLYIVYIDDEPIALQNFKYIMAECKLGDHIKLFSNPDDFLFYAKSNPIDMAFLDVDLPGTTGFVLAKELKDINPNLPIAFITGNIRYMEKSEQTMEATYIFKPYGKEDVLAALPTHIVTTLEDL